MYHHAMDVAVSVLRAELSSWLDRVRAGEEIVVTERGVPVARLSPIASASRVDELVRAGVLSKPVRETRSPALAIERVQASEPVSPLVAEQRRLRGL